MNRSRDNYPIAAVRHFADGKILHNNNRYDNAMCHYAFSTECAIKILYEVIQSNGAAGIGHAAAKIWDDIRQCFGILEVLDARTGVLLGQIRIPDNLFLRHPERRYEADLIYRITEVEDARVFSEQLVKEIVSEALDGKFEL